MGYDITHLITYNAFILTCPDANCRLPKSDDREQVELLLRNISEKIWH